ncbi:MAG: hypothetical protein Q7R63_01335 [bacterium]|nr:hypothetical protein [bacterium]
MKKIIPFLILFFALPLFASAQIKPPENPAWISWIDKVGDSIRKPDGTIGYYVYPTRTPQKPLITGPKGTALIEDAKKTERALFLYNSRRIDPATKKPIKAVGAYDSNSKNNLQPVKCELNIRWIGTEGAFNTTGQVWICTYTDASGVLREFYVPQHDSDDTNKFIFEDLVETKGEGIFFDREKNAFIPPPASTIFHIGVLARAINERNVLMPCGKPLSPNLLSLERKGGELATTVDIGGQGRAVYSLPLDAMTRETKPVVGPNGLSITLMETETPISGSPTAGVVPDNGGLSGGGSKPITTQSANDVFHGNIPFAGGFSIHINLLTINWRSGPPAPMVSDDGKALVFFMGFKGVPFITFITDTNKDHKYEAHIVLFEFDESEKGKPDYLKDWSKIKPVKPPKEFASQKEFEEYVRSLPAPQRKK